VGVGDTWTLDYTWVSGHDHIPLRLAVVGILKDIVPCEKKNVCADIEVSGSVNLVKTPDVRGAKFESRIWGRVLFSIDRGDVIWSKMLSHEIVGVEKESTDVLSCIVSRMQTPGTDTGGMDCEPAEQPVTSVPSL
jgi:hypothetical protein